ncbi:MAG: no significant likey [Oscillospiraceae bacterium]|nr:no significant likey [Oscillospiraceae bacterium]
MARRGYIQDDLDVKVLILYLMARVAAPIDLSLLTDLALCDEGMDYFRMTQAVSELVQTEHIVLEDGRYAITDKGRKNGEVCEDSLPYSVRRRCDLGLARVNTQLRRDAQVRAEVVKRDEGGFTVRLRLDDEGGNLLTLELFSGSEAQGSHLAQCFKEHPEHIFNGILNALLASYEQE